MAIASTLLSPGAAAANAGTRRLLSLDVFRGATILAMILVNNPGREPVYWPLDHAEWHGWTPTDLIFPFFLFIVGAALAYSLRKYRDGGEIQPAVYWRILRRTALLIFLGWMPSLLLKSIAAYHGQTFDLSNLRIFGVLVRIALVYFLTSLIVLNFPIWAQADRAVIILLGYWVALAVLPNPYAYTANLSHKGNIVGAFDRSTIGTKHMWSGDPVTDPEGLLSTFPAIVTALIGYWSGLFIQRGGLNYRTVALLAALGLAIAAIGQLWHFTFPINKKLWTSSFVLLSGGLAMVVLAACLTVFDIWNWRRLARPFEIVGINAIFVFVGSGLLAITLSRTHIEPPPVEMKIMQSLWDAKESLSRSRIQQNLINSKYSETETNAALDRLTKRHWLSHKKESGVDYFATKIEPEAANVTLHGWLYGALWTSWIHDPKLASLGFALTVVTFWWLVCLIMSLFGWSIRV
jgi:predicted acyltransferase